MPYVVHILALSAIRILVCSVFNDNAMKIVKDFLKRGGGRLRKVGQGHHIHGKFRGKKGQFMYDVPKSGEGGVLTPVSPGFTRSALEIVVIGCLPLFGDFVMSKSLLYLINVVMSNSLLHMIGVIMSNSLLHMIHVVI